MDPARRRATYEDVLQAPPHLVAQLIDGELITTPRPALPHAAASWYVAQEFGRVFSSARRPRWSGGWWILYEPELHLGADVLVPDLAGWRHERMPVIPNAPYVELAPDWVCEVLSPTTGRIDRIRKMPIYAREQVAHLWLVDPGLRTLEIYRLEAQRWVVVATHGGDDVIRAEPFDAAEIDLGRWWAGVAPVS